MWIYRCPSDDENSWNTTEECRDLLFTKPAADSKRKSTLYSYCCFCLLACAQTGNGNAIYRSTVDQAKKTISASSGKNFCGFKSYCGCCWLHSVRFGQFWPDFLFRYHCKTSFLKMFDIFVWLNVGDEGKIAWIEHFSLTPLASSWTVWVHSWK